MMELSLPPSNRQGHHFYGVTIALVTNNQDPDNLGRVKVNFPWLSETEESAWARIATPMAGKQKGFYSLPEIDDEVLVAFEHGQADRPYILGSLWNGKDTPPGSNSEGKNNQKMIKSRSGHCILLDDSEAEARIVIQDGSGKNSIVISTQKNTVLITADADITIQSNHGNLILNGQDIEIKAQGSVKIEAQQNCDLKAQAQGNIQANGGIAIKCLAGVKINDGALEVT